MTEISREYAEALFALACETGEENAMMKTLEDVKEGFAENPEYLDFLSSPSIPLEERVRSVEQVFGTVVPPYALSFLQLLCEKRRISMFFECESEYRRLLNQRNAVVTAKVISAVELTEEEKASLIRNLEKKSGNAVTLECTVDPQIMGGVVVEMNGTVMDGSLRHRLREIKEVMNR